MKYETVFYSSGTKLRVYGTNCVLVDDLVKLFTATHKKQVTKYTDRKIYYSYSKFPKKLAQRAGFTTVNDPANADLIVIPVNCSYYYTGVFDATRINDILCYRQPWDHTLTTQKYVTVHKHMNKYADLMDMYKDKCIISSTFYEYCRAYNPSITNSEYANVKELLKSSDKECNILGATLIIQSDIDMQKNAKLMLGVNRICNELLPETNENLEFSYTYNHKCAGSFDQWVR